ncbi:MAG: hypothetical protein JW983_07175 [Elusimicrobia bacterium]|nr:hypothetical protein [Elusimicrobiota bacterium]
MLNKMSKTRSGGKKILAVISICLFTSCYVFCKTPDFDALTTYLEKNYVKSLAKDMGAVIAGNMFHSGINLGFPGVDVGIGMSAVTKPSKGDKILRDSLGSIGNSDDVMYGLPFIYASIGLPARFDIMVRGYPETENIELFGAGLKHCIVSKELGVVELGLSTMYSYNSLKYTNFKSDVHTVSGIFSVKVPVVEPYVGVAFDSTSLETDLSSAALALISKTNIDVSESQTRFVGGLNISPFPFTYINVAGTYSVTYVGVDLGLGFKF